MRDQEIVGLWEAYHQVYAPQEITEEVEIAAQYFYEMGLNEDGVDILIEDLGVEEFSDWVYEIAEDYTLTEARRGPGGTKVRIEPVTAKGQKFKSGKPTGKSLERLRAQKAARREAEEKASAAKPSGLKASLQRQSAITNAKSKQKPSSSSSTQTKKGIGGLIGSIVQRAKQDTELLKKSVDTAKGVAARRGAEVKAVFDVARERGKKVEQSPQATKARRKATVAVGRAAQAAGKTAVKAAGAAGAAAGEGVKAHRQGKTGAQIAGRAAGTFVRKMTKEDYEYAEAWVNQLVEEGYDLSEYTWDDMYEIYEQQLDEGLGSAIKGLFNGRKKPEAPAAPESRGAQLRRKYGITSRTGPESPRGRILSRSQQQIDADKRKYGEGSAPARESEAARNKQLQGGYSQFGMNDRRGSGNAARRRAENLQKEGYDLYDLFLSHLLDEGYADTEEAALAIMTNMSEEWRESIVESLDLQEKLKRGARGRISFATGKQGFEQIMTEKNPKTGRQRATSPEMKAMGAHGRARAAQYDAENRGDTEAARSHRQRRERIANTVYRKTNRIIDRADNN